jgi:hypothetical protein
MTYSDRILRERAAARGTYRVYVARGDSVRVGQRTVSGPVVLRVSRGRVEVYPVRIRTVHS